MNLTRYIGIPYSVKGRSFEACDCWGLVYLIYKSELGITLPSYDLSFTDPVEAEEAKRALNAASGWEPVTVPNIGDVVLMTIRGEPLHVGMYVGCGNMIHTRKGTSVSLQRLSAPFWKQAFNGFYRHVK